MKIDELISELEQVKEEHGENVECKSNYQPGDEIALDICHTTELDDHPILNL